MASRNHHVERGGVEEDEEIRSDYRTKQENDDNW